MPASISDSFEELLVRPARDNDAAAVVAFCQHIWDGNDYVDEEMFDIWLHQTPGPMLVGELAGRPVALAKIAIHADGHAWFQGLRVDPDVQGRGIARRMHEASESAAAAAGVSTWALLTVDAGPTAVQHLCDARGWTIQGQTRYLRLLTESDDGTPPQTAALHLLDAADFPTLTASLDSAPSLTALGGWYTLDWECAPFTTDKLLAHLRAHQVWALPDRRAWGIVTVTPGDSAWWAFATGSAPDLATLARSLYTQICCVQRLPLALHVPTDTPWDTACRHAHFWRDPEHPPKQFRLYVKRHDSRMPQGQDPYESHA